MKSTVEWHDASEKPRWHEKVILEIKKEGDPKYCIGVVFAFDMWRFIHDGSVLDKNITPLRWFYQSDLQKSEPMEPPDNDRDVEIVTPKKGKKRVAWYGRDKYWRIYPKGVNILTCFDWEKKPEGWQPASWKEIE